MRAEIARTKNADKKTIQTKYDEVEGAAQDVAFVLTAGEEKFINQNRANCILCVDRGIRIRAS
jgi:hypothetical protein